MHASTPQPQSRRFVSHRHLVMSQPTSSPSSTDDDAEPQHPEISSPTQQPPPTLPGGTEQDQNSSPAKVSLDLPISTASNGTTALAPSASSPSISDNTATPPSALLSLPEELLTHTLSFLPARETARVCRIVCSELRNAIDRHGNHITRPKTIHKHADLQHRINTLTQSKPHDLASFVSAFRHWVDQRGLARYSDTGTYKPFTDWIDSMLAPDEYEQRAATSRRQKLTEWLVRLQCNIVSSPAAANAFILHETISRVKPEDKGHAQFTEICNQIATQPTFFWFKQLDVQGRGGFCRTYPVLRLSQVTLARGRGSRVLEPFFSPELLAQLALPPLPDGMFCYYVEEEWCRNGLDTGATLSPLAKAALLEAVKIF